MITARRFYLQRNEDETGISGEGIVAEGCEFSSGAVALTWLSEHRAMSWYETIKTVEALHGHGGKTRIVWIDENVLDKVDPAKPKKRTKKVKT